MEKNWLQYYPPSVPAEIDSRAYPSLVDLLKESFSLFPERIAFECMGSTLTYCALDRLSKNFSAWLQACGVTKGMRVALMLPNVLSYPIAMAAVLRAGAVVVNVNPLYTARELEHQLKDAGCEAIVVLENFASVLQTVAQQTALKHIVVASIGDCLGYKGLLVDFVVRHLKKMVPAWTLPNAVRFKTVLAEGGRLPFKPIQTEANDLAFLQYTGGTTGVAKGAMLLHRNIVANVLQSQAWMAPGLADLKPSEQPVTVIALPLYHIFALTVCALLTLRNGGRGILITNPRDIKGFIKTLRGRSFHMLPAVNTLYNALLNHPDFGLLDFSTLRIANGGGMSVQQAVAQRWYELTGKPIIEGYGLSETSPSVTCNPVIATQYSGTIGLPLPSTEVSIRDDANTEVPLGEPGEICIKGPQVMAGYWQRPDETTHAMTADGFFKSGDIGVMDERGYIKIVDRKKDMILVSGFNVYPNEIEDVVAKMPGVLEVAAVGVPAANSGEIVKLYIVKRNPGLTEEDVFAYCKTQLTGYKRPKAIEFRDELPKSNVGKILRRALRESAT